VSALSYLQRLTTWVQHTEAHRLWKMRGAPRNKVHIENQPDQCMPRCVALRTPRSCGRCTAHCQSSAPRRTLKFPLLFWHIGLSFEAALLPLQRSLDSVCSVITACLLPISRLPEPTLRQLQFHDGPIPKLLNMTSNSPPFSGSHRTFRNQGSVCVSGVYLEWRACQLSSDELQKGGLPRTRWPEENKASVLLSSRVAVVTLACCTYSFEMPTSNNSTPCKRTKNLFKA